MAKKHRGLASPKALRADNELGRVLAALEIAECDCPLDVLCLAGRKGGPNKCPGKFKCDECPPCLDLNNPCPHIAAADHDLSLEEWLALYEAYDRQGYADRPPAEPGVAITRESRVALYALRAEQDVSIFCQEDLDADKLDKVAVQAGKGRVQLGIRATRHRDEPKPKKDEM